jgi:hypothetical protein
MIEIQTLRIRIHLFRQNITGELTAFRVDACASYLKDELVVNPGFGPHMHVYAKQAGKQHSEEQSCIDQQQAAPKRDNFFCGLRERRLKPKDEERQCNTNVETNSGDRRVMWLYYIRWRREIRRNPFQSGVVHLKRQHKITWGLFYKKKKKKKKKKKNSFYTWFLPSGILSLAIARRR